MPFDPGNTRDLARLHGAMTQSRRKLEVFRDNRKDLLRQYVGRHYGNEGSSQNVPVNLTELAMNIFLRQLAAKNPKVMVGAIPRRLRSPAMKLKLALDRLFDEIRLVDTLRLFVREALLSIGIIKTGITEGGTVEVDGFLHDVGQPFADVVSLDDWVHDMRAERWDQIAYAGNDYFMPFHLLKETGRFDESVIKTLTPDGSKYDLEDEFGTDNRASQLSQGTEDYGDEFHDYIRLRDVWLPETNRILTLPLNNLTKVLSVIDWEGPERGPYHLLGFSEVPGNIMPLSPLSAGLDLHTATNTLYRKLVNQAERQKDLVTYTGQGAKDAARVQDSGDGDVLRVDHQESVKSMSMGGANSNNFALAQHLRELYKNMLGNLDVVGGLAPQSQTLGQDRMIGVAASKRIEDMQDKVVDATTGVVRSLAWYLWTDPLIELPITKRIGDRDVETSFTAEDREGDFLDYNIRIEPYSMQHRSPSERLQGIFSYLTQILLPSQQAFLASGGQIDFQVLNRLVAELSDEEEINNLVKFNAPGDVPRPGERPIQSPVTSRTNLRINQSASGDPGAAGPDAAAISGMMSDQGNKEISPTAAVA